MSPWLTDKELEILPYWMQRQYKHIRDIFGHESLPAWARIDIDVIEQIFHFLCILGEQYQELFKSRLPKWSQLIIKGSVGEGSIIRGKTNDMA